MQPLIFLTRSEVSMARLLLKNLKSPTAYRVEKLLTQRNETLVLPRSHSSLSMSFTQRQDTFSKQSAGSRRRLGQLPTATPA